MSSEENLQSNRKRRPLLAEHLSPEFALIDHFFSPVNQGMSVNGQYHSTVKQTFEHTLVIGSTGAGKSTKIIIPSLFKMEGSFVVHDPSKEILDILEMDLIRRGYRIEVLNFSEPGSGYNPLRQIKEDSDFHLLADLLVRANKQIKSSEQHWTSRATELIAAMLHLVLKMEGREATLVNVRKLLLEAIQDTDKVERLFEEHGDCDPTLSFKALTKNRTNELSSIFSTASDALKDFANPSIAQVTSMHDIDLSRLRSEKTALFIQNSPNRSHLYTKLISIFFEQLWLHSMEKLPNDSDQNLFVIIDEAASLFLPTLPYKIDKARKYRIGILLAVQSLQQLQTAYGNDASVIEDNCNTHIFLGSQKGETAEKLERALGRKNGKGGNSGFRLPREKVRMMGKDTTLILCNGMPPILEKNVAYFENPNLSHLRKRKVEPEFNASTKMDESAEQSEKEPWADMDKEPDWNSIDFYL